MRDIWTTWKGFISAIDPVTTDVMNVADLSSSPNAMFELFLFMAVKVENMSGLPFPNASKVTPACSSLRWSA